MSRLIQLIDLHLYFSEKICFEAFNYTIHYGERIALIGDNGSGKTSMLKILSKCLSPSDGIVSHTDNLTYAYVPQLIECYDTLSGAERFNRALTQALAQNPDLLILDEPTNHLDRANRQSLMRMLDQFTGTLIIASHDVELLRRNDYCFWHFHHNKISVFQGQFDHFNQQNSLKREGIEEKIAQIKHQKKQSHQALMKEQHRAKNSRLKGEKSLQQAKWPTIVSKSKVLRAQETSGKKKREIFEHKESLIQQLNDLGWEEEITPHFELTTAHNSTKALITISNGSVAYGDTIIINSINLTLGGQDRLVINGVNGSGKSTLIKAICEDKALIREGMWLTPHVKDIGFLDQHYQQLDENNTVLETIAQCRPEWSHMQTRHHLNDFLFRKNEQVYSPIKLLSGGEKARLCLAKIGALPPKLLILDEVTNNLDLKTRNHVITLLNKYQGAFIVISHDYDFLEQINITHNYSIPKMVK